MNAPWPNEKARPLSQLPEGGRCLRQRSSLHPAQTPPHTPRAGQPAQADREETDCQLCLRVGPLPVELSAVAAVRGCEFPCEARLDDAVGISRWRGRWTPVKPPRRVHRETSSQSDVVDIDRVLQRPTIAAQEHTAQIAGTGVKTDMFEGVV